MAWLDRTPIDAASAAKNSSRHCGNISRNAVLDVMALYIFDTDDGDGFVRDDVGMVLPDLDAAKREATMALAEIARDVIPGSDRRTLSIMIRTEQGEPILRMVILFEIIVADSEIDGIASPE